MTASELVSRVTELMAVHGDLEIVFDCDSLLSEINSVDLLEAPYLDIPMYIITQKSRVQPSQDMSGLDD